MTRLFLFCLLICGLSTSALADPSAGIRRDNLFAKFALLVAEQGTSPALGASDASSPELASLLAFAWVVGADYYVQGVVAPAVSLVGTVALADLFGQPLSLGLGGGFAFPSATEHLAAGRIGLTYSFPARGVVRPGVGLFALWSPQQSWGGSATFVLEWLVL